MTQPSSPEPRSAVILAAGQGQRMRPITELIPKPLIPIAGRPFIEYLLQNLLESGFPAESIIVVVGYMHEKMTAHLTKVNPAIKTVHQPLLDGTAGALSCALPLIPSTHSILMMMGDNYFSRRDIAAMLKSQHHAIGAIRSTTPEKYGVLETTEVAGQVLIRRILEKPQHYPFQEHVLVSAGMHYFHPDVRPVLTKIVAHYRAEGKQGEIPLTEVISELAETTSVTAVELQDWQDMGTPADLPLMKQWILERRAW